MSALHDLPPVPREMPVWPSEDRERQSRLMYAMADASPDPVLEPVVPEGPKP